MGICSNCGKEGEFYKRPNGKEYYHCKLCQNAYTRNHYRSNKKQYLDRNNQYKASIQGHVVDYLRSHPCVDCGEADLAVLDFDHVRGKKSRNICDMIKSRCGWLAIRREILKCDVRCANCHRRKTYGHLSKYQRTCRLTDKALVYETSDGGSIPPKSSTALSFSAQDSPLRTEQPRLESV